LPTALEDEVGTGIMAIVPGGLDEDAPGVAVAGLRDRSFSLAFSRGALGRNEAKVSHEGPGRTEAADIVDFTKKCHRG
jgi:hypothetical protein